MPFTQKLTEFNCLVVLGVTASGKTSLACRLANRLNGAIISADSRQVYKHLTIGTGKDLNSYNINGTLIPYYGIDIADPSNQYYLHQFCELLNSSFTKIIEQKMLPVICGGTGLYLDALSKSFEFTQIKENPELRNILDGKTKVELLNILNTFDENDTRHIDRNSIKRIIRGIEVASYLKSNQIIKHQLPYKPIYIGIQTELNDSIKQIKKRLDDRLNDGLIEEVEGLIKMGITHDRLINLGLEYKYTSHYLQNILTFTEFKEQLAIAIIQFSKRQSTWFKKMEKEGVHINWFKQSELDDESINNIINNIKKAKPID